MAREALKFKVGLFVVVGVVIIFVVLTWLGASKYLRKANTYVVYFNESVQGLQMNSLVKYRGVVIGRVDEIRVAPDSRLIEVVLKLEPSFEVGEKVVAQLSNVGITGIVFIELDRRAPDEPDLSPLLSFKPPHKVIPTRPSGITRLLTGLEEIYEKLSSVDFQGISDGLKATLAALEGFISGEKVTGLVTRLDRLAQHVDEVAVTVDEAVKEGRLSETVTETRVAMVELQDLIGDLRTQVSSLELGETNKRVNRLVRGLDRRTTALTRELRATTDNLRRASENLDRLLIRLKTTPSDLIFSRPPRGAGEQAN